MNLILRKKRTSPCYWFAVPIRSQKLVAQFLIDRSCGGNGLKATTSLCGCILIKIRNGMDNNNG
jgi:hypothetical protein